MLLNLAAIIGGLALLVWSADRFVHGAAALSRSAGIPTLVIGMIVVGFGTSAPELAVSTLASLQGSPELAIGNAIGSNIANIGLVLGLCALIRPLVVESGVLRRELPMVLVATAVLLLLVWDRSLDRIDGLVLLIGLAGFFGWTLYTARTRRADHLAEELSHTLPPPMSTGLALVWTLGGLVLLVAASQILIWGAVNIARALQISELVIGLTVVAVGTSLPELAASLAGVLKRQDDIAIGNVLGSNLFNILAILLPPAWLTPGATLDPAVIWRDVPTALILAILLWASAAGLRGRHLQVQRLDGALMLAVYVAYTLILLNSVVSH